MQARNSTGAAPEIQISNFGKINDHVYRGAQPKARDLKEFVFEYYAQLQTDAVAAASKSGGL